MNMPDGARPYALGGRVTVQPRLDGLRVHAAPLPRPSQGVEPEGKPPQAREGPIYLHWLCVRPDRLNSYGRPLCKVPPVADFVRPYTFRIETCDDMHIPKPPASLIPATELGVRPWISVRCTYQGRNFSNVYRIGRHGLGGFEPKKSAFY